MRIEEDLKLGFKDVLFRPKRSTLKSRSQVSLTRQFTFKHTAWGIRQQLTLVQREIRGKRGTVARCWMKLVANLRL